MGRSRTWAPAPGCYAYVARSYGEGDVIELSFDMAPYKVYATSRVPADTGCAAVQRGPVVYCAEGVDNGGDVLSFPAGRAGPCGRSPMTRTCLGGIVPLVAEAGRPSPQRSFTPGNAPRGRRRTFAWCPITPGATGGEPDARLASRKLTMRQKRQKGPLPVWGRAFLWLFQKRVT